MNDELLGFGSVIKSLCPEDYDEICKFAQSVLQKPSKVQMTFEENEFPQFVGKLNCVGKSGASDAKMLSWGTSDLSLGSNFDDKLAAQTHYKIGGGFCGYDREFRVVEIGQHRLIFLRWDKDRKMTRVFWNGKQIATVNRLVAFVVNLFGGLVKVQNPDGDILFTIHFRFALLMFSKRQIRCGENKVLFPVSWPNPGGLSEKAISDFANIPFEYANNCRRRFIMGG